MQIFLLHVCCTCIYACDILACCMNSWTGCCQTFSPSNPVSRQIIKTWGVAESRINQKRNCVRTPLCNSTAFGSHLQWQTSQFNSTRQWKHVTTQDIQGTTFVACWLYAYLLHDVWVHPKQTQLSICPIPIVFKWGRDKPLQQGEIPRKHCGLPHGTMQMWYCIAGGLKTEVQYISIVCKIEQKTDGLI